MRSVTIILSLLCGLAFLAPAAAFNGPEPLLLDAIRTQQAEIRAGVQSATGSYKNLSPDTRSQLLSKQSRVLETISGKTSVDELGPDQRTEVFNALEWIEAAINNAEDERLVCERRAPLGSTMKKRVCRTVAQIREDQERARKELDHQQIQTRR